MTKNTPTQLVQRGVPASEMGGHVGLKATVAEPPAVVSAPEPTVKRKSPVRKKRATKKGSAK